MRPWRPRTIRNPSGRSCSSAWRSPTSRTLPAADALPLALDDDRQIRVRYDYFNLLMDYVYGGERRLAERGERLWGKPLRMGIHQTWHWLPDDAYAGVGDLWRGLGTTRGGF